MPPSISSVAPCLWVRDNFKHNNVRDHFRWLRLSVRA